MPEYFKKGFSTPSGGEDFFKKSLTNFAGDIRAAIDASDKLTDVQQSIELNKVMIRAIPLVNQITAQLMVDDSKAHVDKIEEQVRSVLSKAGSNNLSEKGMAIADQRISDMILRRISSYNSGEGAVNARMKISLDSTTNGIANLLSSGHIDIGDALVMIDHTRESMESSGLSQDQIDTSIRDMKAKVYSAGITELASRDPEEANRVLQFEDVAKSVNNNQFQTLQKIIKTNADMSRGLTYSTRVENLQRQIMTGNFDEGDILSQARTVSENGLLRDSMAMFSQIRVLNPRELNDLAGKAKKEGNLIREKMFTERADALVALAHTDPIEVGMNARIEGFSPIDFNSTTAPYDLMARAAHTDKVEAFFHQGPRIGDKPPDDGNEDELSKQEDDQGMVKNTYRLFTNSELSQMNAIMESGSQRQKDNVIKAAAVAYSLRGDNKELPSRLVTAGISKMYGGSYDSSQKVEIPDPNSETDIVRGVIALDIRNFIKKIGISTENERRLAYNIAQSAEPGATAEEALIKFFGSTAYSNFQTSAVRETVPQAALLERHKDLFYDDGTQIEDSGEDVQLSRVYAGNGRYYLRKERGFWIFGSPSFIRDKAGNKITIGRGGARSTQVSIDQGVAEEVAEDGQ